MKTERKNFYTEVFRLVIPLAFQSLMMAAISASDALILARYDQVSVSSVSLANQIQFVLSFFTWTVVGGTSILATQYYGKGDTDTVKKLMSMGIRLNTLFSLIFFALAFTTPELLMKIYTNDSQMILIGSSYLRIVSFSYLFSGISQVYLSVMKMEGRATRSTVIATVAVFVDVFVDLFLVYGLAGLPRLGAAGSAWSTSVVCAIELIWVFIESLQKNHIHPDFHSMLSFSRILEKDFVKVAYPMLISSLVWGVGFSFYSAIIGRLGSDATAAHSIASVIKDLLFCFCSGIAGGTTIIIGKELGSGQIEEARCDGARFCRMSIIFGLISGGLLLLLSPILIKLFVLNGVTQTYLQQMMIVCAVYIFAKSLNTVIVCGIFSAGGDTIYDAVSVAISMWMFAIPLGCLAAFVFKWPVMVVYLIISSDEIIKLPWIYPRYKKYIWLKNLTRETSEIE